MSFPDQSAYPLLRKAFRGSRIDEWSDRLERYWRGVAAALLISFLLGIYTIFWGIPWLAYKAAFALPDSAIKAISSETIRIMERAMLHPSELDEERQKAIRNEFLDLLNEGGLDYGGFDLRFRASPRFGANAFALPSGEIYVLDGLIALAESDEEIIAVLAHELGHVVERHGVQSVLRSTGIFLIVSVLMGDIASASSIAAALPAILIESSYSRKFEFEADAYAAELLLQTGRSPEALCLILIRLTGDLEDSKEHPYNLTEIFASHPETAKRVKAIRALSEQSQK